MSPYEMVFNQKPRKPIMLTANAHKNAQGHCKPTKDSICYNLPLHAHGKYHFHHPQILKLASGTHTEWILNRDKKHNEVYQKVTKKLLQRQNINNQINQRFTPATDLKIGTFVLIPNFQTQEGISEKLQPLRRGPYQIIAKPTEVTYKFIDTTKKRNCSTQKQFITLLAERLLYSFTGLKVLLAERLLAERLLYSFTGLKVIHKNTQIEPEINETNKNQRTQIQKQDKFHKETKTLNSDNIGKERKIEK